ncbi:cyclic nucleotide-binding domain-containing protein [Thermodesulfobacteriota bacterium]
MSLYEMIKEMPMFESFSEQEKKMFAEMEHSLLEFKNGDTIISDGDKSTSMYLLLKGSGVITKTEDNAKIRLSKLKPGELFGEMSFVSKKPRQSDVIANDDVLVMKIDDDLFNKMNLDIRGKMKNYLIELLIRRLEKMNATIMKLSKLFHL